jgi:hypothetical protein
MHQVIVQIDEKAKVTVEAKGIVGKSCLEVTRAIEQALGRTIGDTKKTEYHQQEQVRARNVAGH